MVQEIGTPPNMAALADRLAIQEVLATHSRGIDRCDSEVLKSCYWPDAEVDYGAFKGSAHEFAGMVTAVLADQFQLTQHRISNTLIALAGSEARSESLCTAYHLLTDGSEEMTFSGRYLDLLERREDRWKIRHRQVVMDWSRRWTVADERDSDAFADLAKGSNTSDDPSYALFTGRSPGG